MPASFDPEPPRYDADELDDLLGRALARSAAIAARRRHRRALVGSASVGLVVAVLAVLVTLQSPKGTQSPPAQLPRASVAPKWKLVADVSAGWHVLPGPNGAGGLPPLDMTCPSASTCYAVGVAPAGPPGPTGSSVRPIAKIEATTDSGRTWTPVMLPVPVSHASLSCVSASSCALLGIEPSGRSVFLETSDGGQTWSARRAFGELIPASHPIGFLDPASRPTELDCVSADQCTAAVTTLGTRGTAAGFSLKTADGGHTWLKERLPAHLVPSSITCTQPGACVVAGSTAPVFGAGAAAHSSDGGATWTAATLPAGTHALQSVACNGSGFCITSSSPTGPSAPGAVLTSSDGGASWAAVPATQLPRSRFPFFSGSRFSCPTGTDCWSAGVIVPRHFTGLINLATSHGFLAQSVDGGHTWQPAPLPRTVKAVLSLACPTNTICYAMAVVATRSGTTFGLLSNRP